MAHSTTNFSLLWTRSKESRLKIRLCWFLLKQTKIDSGNFAAWKGISVVWWGENNTNVVSFRVKC